MNAIVKSLDEKIEALRELTKNLPPPKMPTLNFLLEGMYCRPIMIPKDTAFVGRKHKVPHYFMVLSGGAMVTDGETEPKHYRAGMVFMCEPGSQRIGVTYADTVFVTVHRSDAKDLAAIEADCVEYDPNNQWGIGNEYLGNLLEKAL